MWFGSIKIRAPCYHTKAKRRRRIHVRIKQAMHSENMDSTTNYSLISILVLLLPPLFFLPQSLNYREPCTFQAVICVFLYDLELWIEYVYEKKYCFPLVRFLVSLSLFLISYNPPKKKPRAMEQYILFAKCKLGGAVNCMGARVHKYHGATSICCFSCHRPHY